MKTLILTGWGRPDSACAAAAALRHFRDQANIKGISIRRLPEFLLEVSGYTRIVITGVGLSGNPELLAKALTRLTEKKIMVCWISCLDFPECIGGEIRAQLNAFIAGGSLTDAVSQCYGLACDDLLALGQDDNPKLLALPWQQLLAAAMYFYRNYQDERAYADAIRHLAHADSEAKWTSAERNMVAHYLRYGSREIVGRSEAMGKLLDAINRIAVHERARVLIFGETGVGKETVAMQLHNKSPRRDQPFLAFNCVSVTPNLLESRFFGHEKSAFTGATERREGLFKEADGGTLFLDEISELPLEAQGILLRVLEGGRFTRIGSSTELETDVRLICASNRDLPALVREGKFREDLFHRLNVVQIRVPPLREHKEDIAQIANGYWLKLHRRRLTTAQLEALMHYDYPGNVRELFNLLERASVLEEMDFGRLLAEHRRICDSLSAPKQPDYLENLEEMTRCHVRRIYAHYGGNITQVAEALGTARNTVRKYLKEG